MKTDVASFADRLLREMQEACGSLALGHRQREALKPSLIPVLHDFAAEVAQEAVDDDMRARIAKMIEEALPRGTGHYWKHDPDTGWRCQKCGTYEQDPGSFQKCRPRPRVEYETCPTCRGTGLQVPTPRERCCRCGGVGNIVKDRAHLWVGHGDVGPWTCVRCGMYGGYGSDGPVQAGDIIQPCPGKRPDDTPKPVRGHLWVSGSPVGPWTCKNCEVYGGYGKLRDLVRELHYRGLSELCEGKK